MLKIPDIKKLEKVAKSCKKLPKWQNNTPKIYLLKKHSTLLRFVPIRNTRHNKIGKSGKKVAKVAKMAKHHTKNYILLKHSTLLRFVPTTRNQYV